MNCETPLFEAILINEKESQIEKDKADRIKFIESHMKSLRSCWPEWNGPKVDLDSIDGYCSVHTPIVYSITHNSNQYRYMAPCRIISISDNTETIEVEIEYEKGCTCEHYNGERLRLDIGQVWPPTNMINRLYARRSA